MKACKIPATMIEVPQCDLEHGNDQVTEDSQDFSWEEMICRTTV